MANAVAAVQSFWTDWQGGLVLKEQLDVSVIQNYYPRSMVGIGPLGYVVYADDTQDVQFLGLVEDSVTINVMTGDAQGDRLVNVVRPRYFSMPIASAVITDVGKPVYAAFNNQVQYAAGNFGNLVGFVAMVRNPNPTTGISTEVMIEAPGPHYLRGGFGVLRGQRSLSGATVLPAASINKKVYLATGTYTVTLPALTGLVAGDGYQFFKLGTGTATIDGAGSDQINGAANTTISSGDTALTVQTDGTTWYAF